MGHEKHTVENVSFTRCMASWVALVRTNGAGNSTASKLLIDELKAEQGTIWSRRQMYKICPHVGIEEFMAAKKNEINALTQMIEEKLARSGALAVEIPEMKCCGPVGTVGAPVHNTEFTDSVCAHSSHHCWPWSTILKTTISTICRNVYQLHAGAVASSPRAKVSWPANTWQLLSHDFMADF